GTVHRSGCLASSGDSQDRLDDLTRLRVGQRLLDVAQLVVADESIEREAALLVEIHQRRDQLAGAAASAQHTNDALAPKGAQVVERETGVRRRAADEHERAQHTDGLGDLLDDRDHTRAVDRVVHRRAGYAPHAFDDVGRARVDHVVGAQLLRDLEAAVVQVRCNDPGNTRVAGGHDRCEADSAAPDDQHRVAEARPCLVQYRARARTDAARKRPEQLERCLARHLHERVGGCQRVRGEGGLAEEVTVDGLTVARVGRSPGAFALEPSPRYERLARAETVPWLPVQTVATLPAGRPSDDYLVTRRHLCHAFTHALHDSSPFVTEHCGERHRHVPVARDFVRVTYADCDIADQRLSARRLLELELLFQEGAVLLLHDQRANRYRAHFIILVFNVTRIQAKTRVTLWDALAVSEISAPRLRRRRRHPQSCVPSPRAAHRTAAGRTVASCARPAVR